jgi:hypothetical protein
MSEGEKQATTEGKKGQQPQEWQDMNQRADYRNLQTQLRDNRHLVL